MTSIGVGHEARDAVASGASITRNVLLACGVLSSLLYIVTDIVAGLRYPGYSFTSQNISELAAIGAPTRSFVDPLFVAYDVLALPFAVGVLWEATRRTRALRVTGALLLGYLIIGCVGFALSPMHERGEPALTNDLGHVIVAATVVLLQLVAIAVGAFALGRVFRVYSLATLAAMIVASVPTFAYAPRVAANLPTPGMGILERIVVYAPLVWLAVLGIALMRDRRV